MSQLWISQTRGYQVTEQFSINLRSITGEDKNLTLPYTIRDGEYLSHKVCTPRPYPLEEDTVGNQNGVESISATGTLFYSPVGTGVVPFTPGMEVASGITHYGTCPYCHLPITQEAHVIAVSYNAKYGQVQLYMRMTTIRGHKRKPKCYNYDSQERTVIRPENYGNIVAYSWESAHHTLGRYNRVWLDDAYTALQNVDAEALYQNPTDLYSKLKYLVSSTFIRTYGEDKRPLGISTQPYVETAISRESELPWPVIGASYMESLFPPYERANANWPDLAAEAYSKLTFGAFDGNGLAYLRDWAIMGETVKRTKKTILGLFDLVPGTSKFKLAAKTAAGIFLACHYGFKLQALDTTELFSSMNAEDPNGYQHVWASSSWTSPRNIAWTFRYRTELDTFKNITNELDRLTKTFDLELTLENVWDLVPFSFVVDWCTDVQSVCEQLDTWYRANSVTSVVRYVGRTEDAVRLYSATNFNPRLRGNIRIKYYRRRYGMRLISPNPFYDAQPSLPSTNHLVEGAALVTTFL